MFGDDRLDSGGGSSGKRQTSDGYDERMISAAAQRFGENIQKIVMDAKMEKRNKDSDGKWKDRLIDILGGSNDDCEDGNLDLEILLQKKGCKKFVLRCMENDLPPNLIHCMRLLRVLELQIAATAKDQDDGMDSLVMTPTPISKAATKKVEDLLCFLCIDSNVGEQLRPHLFGLLALSGGRYPKNAVHIAITASNIIIAFAENCLNESLAFFLHEKQMIFHMTDDVKELCGMSTPAINTSESFCLLGEEAEIYGLWVNALRTIITLVKSSCDHACYELLNDFDAAGGYHVLRYAIAHSGENNVKKLLDLATNLVYCNTGIYEMDGSDMGTLANDGEDDFTCYCSNLDAFEIVEDLMNRSVPLLKRYSDESTKPDVLIGDHLREVVRSSVDAGIEMIDNINVENLPKTGTISHVSFFASEILVTTLKMYSDHSLNFSIIEGRFNVLTQYLLSFITFTDVEVKKLVLRTLEFVCTGIEESDCTLPLHVASELFFCICKKLIRLCVEENTNDKNKKLIEALSGDIQLLSDTLEKLLQVDDSLSEIMIEMGLMGDILDELLSLIMTYPVRSLRTDSEGDSSRLQLPPLFTNVDHAYTAICRILNIIVTIAVVPSSFSSPARRGLISPSGRNESLTSPMDRCHDLNLFLETGITKLGKGGSDAALTVLESKISCAYDESLQIDIRCIMKLLDWFAEILGHFTCVLCEVKNRKVLSNESFNFIVRCCHVLEMLKRVLECSEPVQDAFRRNAGFETLLRVLICLKGIHQVEADGGEDLSDILCSLVRTVFGVLDSSMGLVFCKEKSQSAFSTSDKTLDLLSEHCNGSFSSALNNRLHVRDKGFYGTFVSSLEGIGMFNSFPKACLVTNHAFGLLDHEMCYTGEQGTLSNPTMGFQKSTLDPNESKAIRNPDATHLILNIAVLLAKTDSYLPLAEWSLNQLLELCALDKAPSTLSQISNCGLCQSLTNANGFAAIFDNVDHPLYSRFVVLLRRIASFKMSHMDFINVLRCIAGPLLCADMISDHGTNNTVNSRRLRLPTLTSSVGSRSDQKSFQEKELENNLCIRLSTLASIAERGDRVARCFVGGDSLNTIAFYMHTIEIEDKLYSLAEKGRTKFIEVERIDASARFSSSSAGGGNTTSSSSNLEKTWAPIASSGFSYSAWIRLPKAVEGSAFIFDLSTSPRHSVRNDNSGKEKEFISVWYDFQNQVFNVLSSISPKPVSFLPSPLEPGVWHHVLLTYQPQSKRPVISSRKSIVGLCIDGRALETDVKIDSVTLPPTSRLFIGVPNPLLASCGTIHGVLPLWELGSTLLVSTILGPCDALSIFASGPDFQGQFWGDRPQRLSLSATATSMFSMLAECGEEGGVAEALKRRSLPEVEAASHIMRDKIFNGTKAGGAESVLLSAMGLFCSLSPENIISAFHPSSSTSSMQDGSSSNSKRHFSRRLVNVAKINSNNEVVSSDAIIYGIDSVVSPDSFADNVQWAGGPNILLPLVNAARTHKTLALALRVLRESSHRHNSNLEMLHSGGGYHILAMLLREKQIMDESVLDHCFAYAVHSFVPGSDEKIDLAQSPYKERMPYNWSESDRWVLSDLDAMQYLLLNHHVWDLQSSGPKLPARLLSLLFGLVCDDSIHGTFNARRLHLLGIIKWTLHLMLEVTELFAKGSIMAEYSAEIDTIYQKHGDEISSSVIAAYNSGWHYTCSPVQSIAVGADPGIELLSVCRQFLRCDLSHMLTYTDVRNIADAITYTLNIDVMQDDIKSQLGYDQIAGNERIDTNDATLSVGSATRIYLLRLLEELAVDGMNEKESFGRDETFQMPFNDSDVPQSVLSASTTQALRSYSSQRSKEGSTSTIGDDSKKNVHNLLSAFAAVLKPSWFAYLLEGCRDEASASVTFRLLIIMLQTSPPFSDSFDEAGGFAPFVLSIPKYSTSASITLSMLSQLLHVPIIHLPSFATLDPIQLCALFDSETGSPELVLNDKRRGGLNLNQNSSSSGIFALIAECLGRNIQLGSADNDLGRKARETNNAVLYLMTHRHTFSSEFQEFCRSPDFLEPMAQALCLVHNERIIRMKLSEENAQLNGDNDSTNSSSSDAEPPLKINDADRTDGERVLVDWPSERGLSTSIHSILSCIEHNETATDLFVGKESERCGIGLVHLLRHIISHALVSSPVGAPLICALFESFPIHSSPEEIQVFHMVLIEQCRSIVDDCVHRGELVALSNCVGVSSVLLDRLMRGFFASQQILEVTQMVLSTLGNFTVDGTYASRTLGAEDTKGSIISDAIHTARLTCLIALRRSRSGGPWDNGDKSLQEKVLQLINEYLGTLITPVKIISKPPTGTRLHSIWQSASLKRWSSSKCHFPGISEVEDSAFIIALLAEIPTMITLKGEENGIRDEAISLLKTLLHERHGMMSDLLITNVSIDENVSQKIDLLNGGGFGVLLAYEETSSDDDSIEEIRLRSFFDWLDVNHSDLEAVFHGIFQDACRLLPDLYKIKASSFEDAIMNEQKEMLVKLTRRVSSLTIMSGVDKVQLAQDSLERMVKSKEQWKRRGFDDLSAGAIQWKQLLRQLKGSYSLWEGGSLQNIDNLHFSPKIVLTDWAAYHDLTVFDATLCKTREISSPVDFSLRWKLDVTEGYERQRRRLLPNYEFNSLYNVKENADFEVHSDNEGSEKEYEQYSDHAETDKITSLIEAANHFDLDQSNMEATTALLKGMQLGKAQMNDDDFEAENDDERGALWEDGQNDLQKGEDFGEDSQTASLTLGEDGIDATDDAQFEDESEETQHPNSRDVLLASNYDLILGLLKSGDIPEKSYNVKRCTGLEVCQALLLKCRNALYIIDDFEQADEGGLEGGLNRVEKSMSTYYINLRSQTHTIDDTAENKSGNSLTGKKKIIDRKESAASGGDKKDSQIQNQHRCKRLSFHDIYAVYRRRYQLQQNALEFYDVHRDGTFIAFTDRNIREEILSTVLNANLPNSIFHSFRSTKSVINYDKFMKGLRTKITNQWVQGELTNFEFLMYLNTFAGRSYNDLTQYPVFPWVLTDYESDEIDLDDPTVYRDLSKPMGNLGKTRSEQFKERYESLQNTYTNDDDPPPFHYGTHYSCAAYVLNYLLRLEPFSRLALHLQGGRFDLADRLFQDIGSSWRSASIENLQDVRELIPEFFYLPNFLENKNGFDLGTKQDGTVVNDVTLPPWAKGDPNRFVRIHRQVSDKELEEYCIC